MESAEEDSDATVGFSEGEGDELSPSLLYHKNRKSSDGTLKEVTEMSLEMSEELPLQNVHKQTSEPMVVDQQEEEEIVSETQETQQLQTTQQQTQQQNTLWQGQQQQEQASQLILSLDEVEREQLSILKVMESSTLFTGNEITQDKHSKLEKSLVDIGAANLREKTDILSEHSQLSQSLSQLELSEGREELKERLTGLAARQKKLLACLTRQKKITAKLSEKRKQQDTRPSNSQRAITAGSTRDVLSRHHSLTAGQSVPQQTSSVAVSDPTPRKRPQPHTNTRINPQSHTAVNKPVPVRPQLHTTATAKTVPISHVPNPRFQPASVQRPNPPSSTIVGAPNTTASSSSSHLQQPTAQSDKSHPDLSQPVPLNVLVKHNFLKPGNNCLSCNLLGCKFQASLLHSGSVVDQDGVKFSQAHQWLTSCWDKLGHQRKCGRKWTYKTVLYLETPLMLFCEQYSRKQVSSYLTQSQKASTSTVTCSTTTTTTTNTSKQQRSQTVSVSTSNTTSTNSDPMPSQSWDGYLNKLLTKGRVLPAPPSSLATSLDLPTGFWGGKDVCLSPELSLLLSKELEWTHL